MNYSASQHWDKHILVDSVIPISKNSMLLKKGTHAFPFDILLSNSLSESIECGLGHIRYKLHCQVHVKPRFLLIKSTLQAHKTVTLMRLPSLETQQQSITQTHLINDNGGQLTLNIEKGHIVPGTLLPFTFNFNHSCSVHAVDQIVIKLIERQKYKAPSRQSTRILHHEIALPPKSSNDLILARFNNDPNDNRRELNVVYVVPDKHKLKVHPSTSHPNIKVRHWIQIFLRLLLKDGTVKDLQIEASVMVLLTSLDDYLTLPLYNEEPQSSDSLTSSPTDLFDTATAKAATVPHALSTMSIASIAFSLKSASWLQKVYPVRHCQQSRSLDIYDKYSASHNNNLMSLITAPPPHYENN